MDDNIEQASDEKSDVLANVGMSDGGQEDHKDSSDENAENYVQKRLKRQARRHEQEKSALAEKLSALESKLAQLQGSNQQGSQNMENTQTSPVNNQESNGVSLEETIIKAIDLHEQQKIARQREAEEQRAQYEAQQRLHQFESKLVRDGQKYEDFGEAASSIHGKFTPDMINGLMITEDPAAVVYKLAKEPETLSKISQLHPHDQQREINKLGLAIAKENWMKSQTPNYGSPISPTRSSGNVNSPDITSMTSSNLRRAMRDGKL